MERATQISESIKGFAKEYANTIDALESKKYGIYKAMTDYIHDVCERDGDIYFNENKPTIHWDGGIEGNMDLSIIAEVTHIAPRINGFCVDVVSLSGVGEKEIGFFRIGYDDMVTLFTYLGNQ